MSKNYISNTIRISLLILFSSSIFLLSALSVYAQNKKTKNTDGQEQYVLELITIKDPKEIDIPAPPELDEILSLTAQQAADIAMRFHPEVNIAKYSQKYSQGNIQKIKSALYPNLSGTLEYMGYSPSAGSNPSGSSSSSQYSYYSPGLSLSQLIYDGKHTKYLIEQAKAEERAAWGAFLASISDAAFNAKSAYYNYRRLLYLVKVYELNLENQKAHMKMAEERYNAGVGLPSDAVRTQAAVSEAAYNLTQARTEANVAKIALAKTMGIDPRTPLEITDDQEEEIQFQTFEELCCQGLQNRPEILIATTEMEAAEYQIKAAKTLNNPSIRAQAEWIGRDRRLGGQYNYLQTNVTLNVPILDGGNKAGEITQAQANFNMAYERRRQTEQDIIEEISQAYLELENAKQSLETSKNAVKSAKEAHRLAEGRYIAGVGILLDVLDAQNTLLRAESNVITAESNLNTAKAALKKAIGLTR